jgi:hypothetical protein
LPQRIVRVHETARIGIWADDLLDHQPSCLRAELHDFRRDRGEEPVPRRYRAKLPDALAKACRKDFVDDADHCLAGENLPQNSHPVLKPEKIALVRKLPERNKGCHFGAGGLEAHEPGRERLVNTNEDRAELPA